MAQLLVELLLLKIVTPSNNNHSSFRDRYSSDFDKDINGNGNGDDSDEEGNKKDVDPTEGMTQLEK